MSAKNLFRRLMTKAFRPTAPAPIRKAAPRRTTLALEQVEDRITPATYDWDPGTGGSNTDGTLTILLGTNQSVTISESGGTRSFTLSSGTFTVGTGSTAAGNGSPTITFGAADDINASTAVFNFTAAAGSTNNVTFNGGHYGVLNWSVQPTGTGTTGAITFAGGAASQFDGAVNLESNGAGITDTTGWIDAVTYGAIFDLEAPGQDIILDNPLNNFDTTVFSLIVDKTPANAITMNATFVDVDGFTLDSATLGGNLSITAGGAIGFRDSATVGGNLVASTTAGGISSIFFTAKLVVTGTSTLNGGGGSISLTNSQNNFGGVVSASNATDVTLHDTNAITLGTVTATGNVIVNTAAAVDLTDVVTAANLSIDTNGNGAGGGTITDTGAGRVAVTGTTTLDSVNFAITLDNAAGDLGTAVVATAGSAAVTLTDANGLSAVSITTTSGAVTLVAVAGSITDADASTDIQGGAVSITAPGGVGAAGFPLALRATSVTTSSTNTSQFLTEFDTVNVVAGDLNAGAGTISLVGGTFVETTGGIADASAVDVNGATLNIAAVNDAVALLRLTSGTVTGTTGVLTSTANIDAQSGTIAAILGGTAGLTKTTAGTVTLSKANTYTGVTTVNDGTLLLTGSLADGAAANDVVVNGGGTLAGTGTTNGGGVLVNSGGHLAPGTSPGVINTGSITLTAGAVYDVEFAAPYATAGTGYDQANVTGIVTLGGATLNPTGGTVAGTPGQTLTIINNDGIDGVIGTFAGLPDGATVSSGSFVAYISYFGGDGNDVTLTVGGANPVIIGGAGPDNFELRRVNATTQVLQNGTVIYAAPTAAITSLQIGGAGGNDNLFVNFAGGNPIPTGGVTFNGNAESGPPGDSITTSGGTFDTIRYSFTNPNDGSIAFDPDGPGPLAPSVVTYTGLEPVTDNNDAANRVLDYTSAVSETITLQDDGNLGNNMTQVTSTQGETTTFTNPTATLTINAAAGAGAAVADTIVVTALDTGLSGRSITINAGTAGDTVNLSNGSNFAAATPIAVNTSGGDDVVNVSVNGANSNLTINTGVGAADAVNVGFTAPAQSFGQGNLEGINGTVAVTDAGDGLTLQVDDFTDNDVDGAVTFTSSAITGAADAGGSISYTNVSVLNYNLPNVAGTPGDQVNVQSTAAATTANLFGNLGDDVFTVGNASAVTGVLGPVTINGNGGADTVNYNSQNDPSGTYTVTGTTVQRTGTAAVTYATIETLNVNTSDAAGAGDTVNVTGTAAGVATTVNANDGTDTVTVTATNATGPLTVNGGPALDTVVVGSTDTTTTGLGAGSLNPVAGPVVVNGDAGGADLIVDGSAAIVAANYQITSTTVTRSTPAPFGGVTYGTLTTLRLKTGTGANVIDVPSTAVPTAILTSAGADTIDVGGTTALTLANIAAPVTVDGGTGAGSTTDTDTVNVNDQNSAGSFTYTIGTAAILRGVTTVVANYNVGGRTENLNVNGSTAGNNTYNVTGTSATVGNTVNDGTAAASGNGTFNIQANAVQAGAANTFNGFLGTDTFNVNFAAGTSVPNAAGTTFVVNGGAPAGTSATRDVVNINTTAAGDGVRTVGITYAATPGDVDVTGLGALLDVNGVETVVYTGDAANNDVLTVTGTAANDDITVAPQTLSSALVFLGGNPFDGPPEVSTQLIGLAGGGAGPDMHLRGLATSTGLTIDGGAGTANHLYVYGRSEASLTDPATAPLDPFGFGAGVLIPGAGVGTAYDNLIISDAAVRFTAAPNPMAADVRLTTNVVTASFLQAAPNLTGLTVNPGDEAAPGAGGVADSVFATLSFNYRIQVNGGNPLPAGAPNGDELNVVAPAEINIWSDQLNPPTVTFNSAGSQQLGFSSIERLTLTPGNGVVNVIGDNNNPATPQADTVIVQGDGPNQFDLSINGSAPIQFLGTTALNVFGGQLDDTTAITPFATAIQPWNITVTVDGQATGATGDRLIYTNAAGLFDDTHVQATGLGAGRINAHGIGAHTTDQVVRFLNTEQVTVLANAGDADALTLDLTTAADAVTFVFDPATAPVTPPVNAGVGLPGQSVAQVANDVLLTNLFNLVIDANNAGLVVNGDAGADTFLVALNGAGAGALPLALTINAGVGADAITLQGNAGADTFDNAAGIDAQAGVTSLGGTDTAAVSYTGVEALVYDGGADGSDVVNLTGTPGNDTVTVTETSGAPAGTAAIDGQPGITFTGIGTGGPNPVRVATFGGDDEITFDQAVNWGITQVSVDAGPPTGSDTFQVNGTANPDDFTFNPTTRVVTVTPTGGTTVTYTPTNVEVFVLDGGDPSTLPGDLLTVATGMSGIATPPSGTLTASGLVLNYQNFERVVVDAAPTQVDDANTAAGNGVALPRAIEDAAVILDVLANDTFAASIGVGGATIQLVTLPTSGTVQILAATDPANPTSLTPATAHQVIRYTPAANFFGTDTFTYRPVDRNGQASTAAATVTVTVNPVNDEPTFALTNTPVVVAEDDTGAVQTVQVATNISVGPANEAAAGQTAAFTVTNNNAALFAVAPAISPAGVLTFTLAPNQNGTATLTVFLQDTGGTADGGDDTSPTVQFVLTVTPVNDAPTLTAAADVTTNEDTPVAVPGIVVSDVDATVPAATDFDVTVTLALAQPAIGTLAVQPANGVTVGGNGTANVSLTGPRTLVNAALGTLLYTPNANRNGTDTITVTADDRGNIGGGSLTTTDTILVTVTAVNDAPVANPDFATTAEDTPVTIDVRANDTDVETAPTALTVAIATAPLVTQGTVAVVANQIVFTPALDFNGTATFTYTVTDGGDGASPALTSAPALVTVTVTAVNDPPVNGVPAAQTTAEDTPLVFTGANALTVSDAADGDQGDMTATVTVTNGRFTLSTVAGLAVAGNGTATVTLTGTVAAVNAALNGASYTPNANFNGAALLTLTTSDNGNVGAGPAVGLTDSDTVAITVTPVNDAPTVAGTAATTPEDTAVDIDLKPFVTDVETAAGAMTYNLGGATNGTVAYLGNGVVRFTPTANYSGPAGFTYSVTDTGDGAAGPATSNTATVTVTVTPVADAPTLAVTSPIAGNEGAAIPLTINAALTDPSETLTVSITGFPAGTVFSAGVNNGTTLELTAAQVAGLTARFPDNGVFNLQVTATSTESDGSTATTPVAPSVNLVVTVNNVNPTATLNNGGPVSENSTGTVSFTNQADQAQADVVAGLRYSYDFDNDGTFEIGNGTYAGSVTSATATVPASFLADGPGTRTVAARIVDKDGGLTDYTTTITITNVAPTATFGVSGPLVPGQPATVSFSNQADPSAADVAAGFTYQYDLGTGVFGPATTSPTATFTPPAPGTYTLRGRIIDKDGGTTEYSATAGVGAGAGQVVVANVDTYAVGAGPGGGPVVKVYRAFDNSLVATIVAYEPGFRGGVNATMADVTGDGVPDLITGTGVGGGPVVKVFDGTTYAQVASFYAYEPTFRGGVTVAAGDITGTGVGSIVTGSGFGGGPVVKVFTGAGVEQRSFLAYGESQRGGVNVGVGQLNPTGPASIITGAGRGGAPHVKTFTATGAQQLSFFAYEQSFTGGVYVSGGRLYGTGNGSIVTGTGLGGGPVLRVFDGVTAAQLVSTTVFGPDAYGRSLREGFTVNATHIGGATGSPLIVVGSGPDYGPTVRVLNAATLAQVSEILPYELDFNGGVYVG